MMRGKKQQRPRQQRAQRSGERQDSQDRPDRQDRQDRPDRQHRQGRPERQDHQDRPEWHQDHQDRPEWHHDHQDRPEREEALPLGKVVGRHAHTRMTYDEYTRYVGALVCENEARLRASTSMRFVRIPAHTYVLHTVDPSAPHPRLTFDRVAAVTPDGVGSVAVLKTTRDMVLLNLAYAPVRSAVQRVVDLNPAQYDDPKYLRAMSPLVLGTCTTDEALAKLTQLSQNNKNMNSTRDKERARGHIAAINARRDALLGWHGATHPHTTRRGTRYDGLEHVDALVLHALRSVLPSGALVRGYYAGTNLYVVDPDAALVVDRVVLVINDASP
jgi:hypothetical protein